MLGSSGTAAWAHPLTEVGALPFSPLTAAALGVMLIVLFATLTQRAGEGEQGEGPDGERRVTREKRSRALIATRVLALAVFLVAVVAGRLGSPFELENLAPVLLVGVAWSGLALACALFGRVWPWVDPFDSLAAALGSDPRADAGPTVPNVAWAVPAAIAWSWYLSVYPDSLSPRIVGAAGALYTILIVAACLALGRRRVLARGELFGVFYQLIGGLRSAPRAWSPPRNSDVLLAILVGGLLFGGLRRSVLWGELNASPRATLLASGGLVAGCALTATLVWLAGRGPSSRRASIAVAMTPLAAAVVVAVSMTRNRLTTSLQLLPDLLLDPFGAGPNPIEALSSLDPNPLGTTGRIVLQMAVLVIGGMAGAVAARRRCGSEANRAVGAVCVLTAVGVIAVSAV